MESLREILTKQANGDFEPTEGGSSIPPHDPEDMKCLHQALNQLTGCKQDDANAPRLLPPSIALPLML